MEIKTDLSQEPVSADYWTDVLKPVFQGMKVILAGDVIAGLLPRAEQIRELGAESTFMLATEGMGTGEVPTEKDGKYIALDPPPHLDDLVEALHAGTKILGNLPQQAEAALNEYDPDHEAMVVGTFLHEQPSVAKRKSLAYRKPEWLALDDKTTIDILWDKIGVIREPSEVVAIDKGEILAATRRLDKGHGVVWSGDSRDGVGGAATGVRWVRSEADADESLEYYQKHCDHLRVMPFLEGIPCSIHGIVFPDYIAALRPVEMVVLRKSASNEFFYAGTATYWDPAPEDRADMRNTAKRVGEALRNMVDYRGIFTVDGVMTIDGFRPTELNPRSGAGIKSVMAGMSDLPLDLIAQTLVAGCNLDYRPKDLEALIIRTADEQRGGGTWRALPTHLPLIDKKPVKLTGSGWEWSKNEDADGTVSVGPGPLGSFVRLTPTGSAITAGPSFGPLARDFWRFIDESMDSRVGDLEPAKSIR